MSLDLSSLSFDQREKAAKLLKALEISSSQRRMYKYRPMGHPDTLCPNGRIWKRLKWENWTNKPWQLDFHSAGADNQERMICTSNRSGKSEAGGVEVALHMTGDYPDWWEGRRFKKAILVWTGSPTNETSRDIVQKKLLGGTDKETLGTGFIPKDLIIGRPKSRQCGVSDVVDAFKVRHISGGISICVMKTYEQGWRKWQGTEPEVVWLDEEPEDNEAQGKIYSEALIRLLTSHGIMMVTFTPLLGITRLVEHYQKGGEGVYLETASWDDSPHLNKKERDRLAESFEDHERDARTHGIPMLGEGKIFLTAESHIRINDFTIPSHYGKLKGIDFGIDHPSSVVDIAWDRDKDIIYITRAWKKKNCTSEVHAEEINKINGWVPVAWPHDGTNREKGSGEKLKNIYIRHGVRMLSKSARVNTDSGGSQKIEPILIDIKERLETGGIRVFASCHYFFEEYRNFHRKEGLIVNKRDDIIKAFMYAFISRRYCKTQQVRTQRRPPMGLSTRL